MLDKLILSNIGLSNFLNDYMEYIFGEKRVCEIFTSLLLLTTTLFFSLQGSQEVKATEQYIEHSNYRAQTKMMELTKRYIFDNQSDFQFQPDAKAGREQAISILEQAFGVKAPTNEIQATFFGEKAISNKEVALKINQAPLSTNFEMDKIELFI